MNPDLASLTAADLRALLTIGNALARIAEAIDHAQTACRDHNTLAGVPELLAVLERVAKDIDDAHPADLLLPKR